MKLLILSASLLCGGALIAPIAPVYAQVSDVEEIGESTLASITLPAGTLKFAPKAVPQEITDALKSMMASGGDGVKQGRTEVFGWSGKGYKMSKAGEYKTKIGAALKRAGWEYEEGEKIEGAEGATLVTALKTLPSRKALIGFWAPTEDALILAWTEMLPSQAPAKGNTGIVPKEPKVEAPIADDPNTADTNIDDIMPSLPDEFLPPITYTINKGQYVLNIMKNARPELPSFPELEAKPGKVCGYVKDNTGKPLQGAVIGVRSTAVGGAETSASAKTDANGYYEILVPFGAAGFYNAGYAIDYGEGRAALGLLPADGEADEFASAEGHVENWVMLPYGIADRDGIQENPKYLNNYFGGSVNLEFHDQNSAMAGNKGLPEGAVAEITLIPRGLLPDGTKSRVFVINKTIREGDERTLHVNNIPIGPYRIIAKMKKGGRTTELQMKEFGPDTNQGFGLQTKEVTGTGELTFRPYGAKADRVTATHGNWKEVNIMITQ